MLGRWRRRGGRGRPLFAFATSSKATGRLTAATNWSSGYWCGTLGLRRICSGNILGAAKGSSIGKSFQSAALCICSTSTAPDIFAGAGVEQLIDYKDNKNK